ncbi:MAG: stage III sporulation protein AE [Firmicutes bacterium]|nr:stage III sporulation protein AE [Alicyclobacillaceae bacterium]MCL6496669.1 stage III sporulation protein AE [Bacillota bacterium]
MALGHGVAFAAGPLGHAVAEQAASLPDQAFNHAVEQLLQPHPGVHLPSISEVAQDLLAHRNPVDLGQLLPALGRAAVAGVAGQVRWLGIILLLAVLGAVLERLAEATEMDGVVGMARIAVTSSVIVVAVKAFGEALGLVEGLVTGLVHLMEALIPLVVVLMAGSGALASAGMFHPLMLATVNVVAVLARRWVLPLILMAAVVEVLSEWLPRFSLRQLALLFRQAGLTLLGGLLTLFLGVMAVEGAAGSVADGLTLRTGKFLMGTFVPVVGKMFSDAMEAILGSSLLLKNAVSLVGALAVIVAVSLPVVQLFAVMFSYRVAAAASEPLGVESITKSLTAMANAIGWLIAVAGAVGLMFFLMIAVVAASARGVVGL